MGLHDAKRGFIKIAKTPTGHVKVEDFRTPRSAEKK